MKTIYLDHAGATPVRDEVFSAMTPYLQDVYGNPSSIHHVGRASYDAITKARSEIARALGVHANEIIFTSGGTEANNLALFGVARREGGTKKHILVSAIEHKSVLETAHTLSQQGFDVEYIPVDEYGMVHVEDVLAHVRNDTAFISVMYANNEIGTIEPIAEIAKSLREKFGEARPLFHTDACQAPGQLNVSPRELGVDLMTLNSGKIYGPKGMGMLYVREGVSIAPHIVGGEQERHLRAGTENVAGIVGFARALTLATEEQTTTAVRLSSLRDRFIYSIRMEGFGAILNGHETERLPGNIHFSFPAIEGEALVLLLDSHGICASTGSACNAHNLLPSHVLRATKRAGEHIHGSLRLTLGRNTTAEELDITLKALIACVERLRALSPLPLKL
jgi:cysteine desulfurase